MACLFFLPWCQISEPLQVAGIHFIPYERTKRPGQLGMFSQSQLDAVLGNYGEPPRGGELQPWVPRRNAVLLHWDRSIFGEDVGDDVMDVRRLQGEILTTAALSARSYGSFARYTNSAEWLLVGQKVDMSAPASVVAESRRRDGGLRRHFSTSIPRQHFTRPLHVAGDRIFDIDQVLFEALLQSTSSPRLLHLIDAVVTFNAANTDAGGHSKLDAVDLVLMRAAFETLLQASHRSRDLKDKLLRLSHKNRPLKRWTPGPVGRTQWQARWKDEVRPLAAWTEDFCATRNSAAHGQTNSGTHPPPVWSRINHLMFSSWLFPLLLKRVLVDAGIHALSECDRFYLSHCERFITSNVAEFDEKTGRLQWGNVEAVLELEWLARILA